MRIIVRLFGIALVLGLAVFALAMIPASRPDLPARQGPALAEARSWGYQLQYLKPSRVPHDLDVLVVDYSRDGSDPEALTPAEVEALRSPVAGRRRIVLSYLSIGEAESYRYYWWNFWRVIGPSWLGRENKEWKGNYPVRYWRTAWQRVMVAPDWSLLDSIAASLLPWHKPYLDRILEAGFDGVYLDRVDVFAEWRNERESAEADMVDFVETISRHAKSRRPGFLIVPQNGEELLSSDRYRRAIDGIAKEDLLFGIGGDGRVNPEQEVVKSTALLSRLKAEGKPVLVVEYLSDQTKRESARSRTEPLGFVVHFARRDLAQAPEPPLPLLTPPPAETPRSDTPAGTPASSPQPK